VIPGILWFTPALNRGAAFSLFGTVENGNWLLLGVSAVMIIWLLVLAFRQYREAPIWTFALILGGAVGNMVDRLLPEAAVRDFIDLRWWPIFNLADVWICVGVFALIFWSVFLAHRKDKPA
jgi:signal peptidase II